MNQSLANTNGLLAGGSVQPSSWRHPSTSRRLEMLLFGFLLAVFSGPVLFGSMCDSMVFQPSAVRSGEWWRLFTHPFVHVTWYHLLLDGAAFFLLYEGLLEKSFARRLIYVVAGAAGSLLLSWAASPAVATTGLCGLSGIAHGLMAVSSVEMMTSQRRGSAEWRIGLITFLIVIGKAAIEAATGRILFAFLYFGMVGDPVAVSHAGGTIGSLGAVLLLRALGRRLKSLQAIKR